MTVTLYPSGPATGVDLGEAGAVVTNYGDGTVSYSDTAEPFVAEGTIAATATATLSGTQFFRATTGAVLGIVELDASLGSLEAIRAQLLAVESDSLANTALITLHDTASVYHVKRDGGALGDGSADDMAAINDLIADLGTLPGLTRLQFSSRVNETYLLKNLIPASNVWLDLDTATIKRDVDHGSSIIRAFETPTARTWATTGTTTNGSAVVTGITNPAAVVVGRGISGTGIPGGATVLAMDFANSALTLSANATASATVALTISGNTYYGTYENIRITGGTLDCNGKVTSHVVRMLYQDGLEIEGLRVANYPSSPAWAMCLGGRDGRVTGAKIEGGSVIFQDGLHLAHGQRWAFSDCEVECGDDALALGSEPTDPYLAVDPDPIRHVTATGIKADSGQGFGFKAYVSPDGFGPNYKVMDFDVQVTGKSGKTRNGGVALIDFSHGLGSTSIERQIERGTVRMNLQVASGASHDGVNPYDVWINSVESCKVIGFIEHDVTPFTLYHVRDAHDVDLDVRNSDGTATVDITGGSNMRRFSAPYDPAVPALLTVDAAAATASLRRLGTGALNAAPGTVDAAAGVGSVRTLGNGALQAVPGAAEARIAPTLAANWSNFGSGYEPIGYFRWGPFVVVSGVIVKSIAGVAGENIFNLPVGYRPATGAAVIDLANAGGAIGRIDISVAGDVKWQLGVPTVFFSINTIFRAA